MCSDPLYLLGKSTKEVMAFLCPIMIRGYNVNVTGDVNLDHWVKIMSASILYFKVIVFPLPDSISCESSPPTHVEGVGSLAK